MLQFGGWKMSPPQWCCWRNVPARIRGGREVWPGEKSGPVSMFVWLGVYAVGCSNTALVAVEDETAGPIWTRMLPSHVCT